MNTPEGWGYEGPDESVGIFGEQWTHEDCEVLTGPGHDEYKGVEMSETQIGKWGSVDSNGMAMFVRTLKCNDCGQKVSFNTVEFMGLDEEAA